MSDDRGPWTEILVPRADAHGNGQLHFFLDTLAHDAASGEGKGSEVEPPRNDCRTGVRCRLNAAAAKRADLLFPAWRRWIVS